MDFRFKDEVGDELRLISLVSSGDPVIHMWIMAGCVCWYTARAMALCALDLFFSLFR